MSDAQDYYKLVLTYEVVQESLQSYYPYVMGKYVPTMQQMGLEMLEAWTTSWGNGPSRHIVFASRDREMVEQLLDGETWEHLNEGLSEYVTDFAYKVIPFRHGFQL